MGLCFDSLLCDEVDFDYNEYNNINNGKNDENEIKKNKDEFFINLPVQSEECIDLLIKNESDFMPKSDYLKRLRNRDLDLKARNEVVDWIAKVHAYYNFGPLCANLAVNYLDRYLSTHEPLGKAWSMQLLAVACLSIAAKMEETHVPLCMNLQVGKPKFMFEAKTITRMELLVLSNLKWRMQAITPFSFIDYFLTKINGDKIPLRSSINLSTQLILSLNKGIDYLKFRPSEVAAAVAVSVKGENQTVDIEKLIHGLTQHVEKERILECVELLRKQSLMYFPLKSSTFWPHSPIGVLDAASFSYKSDDKTVASYSESSQVTPESKRRKLNMSCEVEIKEGITRC